MQFGPLELQACGENNFTMKTLGFLAFNPTLLHRFVENLFGTEAFASVADDGDISILFFSRVGLNFFREVLQRTGSTTFALEAHLNQALDLPKDLKWRKNANGKLTQPSGWTSVMIDGMLQGTAYDQPKWHQRLAHIQDVMNTEPDVVLQWGRNIAIVEVKVLMGEGQGELARQHELGEFLAKLLGWECHYALIGPPHLPAPVVNGYLPYSWAQVATWFDDTPPVADYIRQFAFFYKGVWQSMVAPNVSAPGLTAVDLFEKLHPDILVVNPTPAPPRGNDPWPNAGVWHPHNLGVAYFQAIATKVAGWGLGPIARLWTGRMGTPYAQTAGLKPNWMIESGDGNRWTNRKGCTQPHQFNQANMHEWQVYDLQQYFGIKF